jgi:hypothetical protein
MAQVDYAEIGSELEGNANGAELKAFANEHGTSTDPVMRELAGFALFKCSAQSLRLAGRIDEAQLAEYECEAAYKRLPESARW